MNKYNLCSPVVPNRWSVAVCCNAILLNVWLCVVRVSQQFVLRLMFFISLKFFSVKKPNTMIIIIIIITVRPHLQFYLIICFKLYIYNEQIQAVRLLTDRHEPKILIFIIRIPCFIKKKKKNTNIRHHCLRANRSAVILEYYNYFN